MDESTEGNVTSKSMQIVAIIFFIIGVLFLCAGAFMTPELVASRFSQDGILEAGTIERVQNARLLAFSLGVVVALFGVFLFVWPGLLALRWGSHLTHSVVGWSRQPRAIWLILLVIILAGITLRCYFYIGFVRTDSFWTTASAHSLARGGDFFEYATYYGRARRVLIYGTWLMFKLFGRSDFSASALPMLFSVGMIPLIFLIGRKLWTARLGLLAAAIYAIAPPEIAISSFLLPDAILPFFIGLSVLFFLYGKESKRQRLRQMLFFMAGVIITSSFFVREDGPMVIGIFAMNWVLFDRRHWRDYLWVVGGFMLSLVPAVLLVWDDVVFTFAGAFSFLPGRNILEQVMIAPFYKPQFLSILVTEKFHQFLYIPALGSLLFGMFYYWQRRKLKRSHLDISLVLTWFLWFYLFLDFIAPHLVKMYPEPRFTSILLPPAVLALAWGMWRFWGFVQRRAWSPNWKRMVSLIVPGYLIFIMAISYAPLKSNQHQYYNVEYYWKVPATYLGKLDPKPIHFIGQNTRDQHIWDKKMSFFLDYRWPDVPYYVQHPTEQVYPGVKDEYLPLVLNFQSEFLDWYDCYVLEDIVDSRSLARSLYSIEDAYVLANPNSLAKSGLDYLIPEDWIIVKRFQEIHNWRERDRILYEAPEKELPAESEAWYHQGLQLAEKGDLEEALKKLRVAILLDPNNNQARALHENVRLRLYDLDVASDELNVALLRTGTRIEDVKGEIPDPLDGVAEVLTLPRKNRWSSGRYLRFSGESELPVSLTLDFGQVRAVHGVRIQWRDYPSIKGSSWRLLYDAGDGAWHLLDQVEAAENKAYELLLSETLEMEKLKLVVTSINEGQRQRGIRIDRVIVY